MSKLNYYEQFALTHYLSDYPDGHDVQSICSMLKEYSDDVTVWDIFYGEDPEDIIREIKTLIITLEQSFVPRQ